MDSDSVFAFTPEAEAQIDLALAEREALTLEVGLFEAFRELEASFSSILEAAERPLDPAAQDLIVRFETGGRAYYDKKLARPTYPGYSSGVTIGFGYDLQADDSPRLERVWGHVLSADQLRRLSAGCGLNGSSHLSRIRAVLSTVQDIVIPWAEAEQVFRAETVPRYRALLFRHLPEMREAPPKCEGALLSLVFNRGASFSKEGNRYHEMRELDQRLGWGVFGAGPLA